MIIFTKNYQKISSLSITKYLCYWEQLNSIFNQYTNIEWFISNKHDLDKEIKRIINIKEKRRKHKTIFNQKFLNKFILTKDLLDISNKLSKYIQKHC